MSKCIVLRLKEPQKNQRSLKYFTFQLHSEWVHSFKSILIPQNQITILLGYERWWTLTYLVCSPYLYCRGICSEKGKARTKPVPFMITLYRIFISVLRIRSWLSSHLALALVETAVRSNIAQIFDVGIYCGFCHQHWICCQQQPQPFLFSSECHPAPHSSTTCIGEHGKNPKTLKDKYYTKEDARKRKSSYAGWYPILHITSSLLSPSGLSWLPFLAIDR